MGARELALAMGQPERTVRRWLALWRAAGVRGIDVVQVRGPLTGYRVHPSLLRRWREGRLPAPHESALSQAA